MQALGVEEIGIMESIGFFKGFILLDSWGFMEWELLERLDFGYTGFLF